MTPYLFTLRLPKQTSVSMTWSSRLGNCELVTQEVLCSHDFVSQLTCFRLTSLCHVDNSAPAENHIKPHGFQHQHQPTHSTHWQHINTIFMQFSCIKVRCTHLVALVFVQVATDFKNDKSLLLFGFPLLLVHARKTVVRNCYEANV